MKKPKLSSARIAIPVVPGVFYIAIYWGKVGFTPDYDQHKKVFFDLSSIVQQTISGVTNWIFDTSILGEMPQNYDLYFTFVDTQSGESDFSQAITVAQAQITPPPPAPSPVLL